ncbi:MAG: pullulanase-type alpha-1,6-glucosidase [Chloroflexi bacterium]|nr:pullulanase-type alpha-1,6-glucosidase [Chloroflexota bacterium]
MKLFRRSWVILLVLVLAGLALLSTAQAQENTPRPDSVTIAGTIQAVLGCANDWAPECDKTFLTYDPADDLWVATFELPAGSYEYKAALNAGWDENYGLHAEPGGANIPLVLDEDKAVTFFYDHKTHWVSDNVNSILANVPGSYQAGIGCPGDWAPDCLRSLLQDPDGDGVYAFSTSMIPAGDWEAKVAYNQSWDLNYGADGAGNGPNILFNVPAVGHNVTFTYNTADNMITITVSEEPVATEEEVAAALAAGATIGDLNTAKAVWVNENTIAWNLKPGGVASYKLHYAPDGGLKIEEGKVVGGETISLRKETDGLSEEILAEYPHLAGYTALTIKDEDLPKIPDILKGQFAISITGTGGQITDATSVQFAGVLDALYTYDGELGLIFDNGVPTLKVWAPTAKSVKLHLFADPKPDTASTVYDMTLDPEYGVWSVTGEAGWNYQYYLYEVEVYVPSTGAVEHNLVTDPYSVSLSTNSQRSQIVDLLNDTSLMPPGWNEMTKPALETPEDIVLYELHVRDFSASDPGVPDAWKGTFMAFTAPESAGMQHLKDLAAAGLTHIHLLPVFDIATINENKAERVEPDAAELASFPADSDQQQALIDPIRDQDAFNWGYDPFHYTVPEGSYATNPNGTTRILQFRRMVQSLNDAGLRVVLDVVYNHTNSSGQGDRSVLDKVVPGYYHRLNALGGVEHSTCCENTATENAMMEKLMIDSVIMWSKAYKIDGYRFDLMGHHMKSDMEDLRAALDALTLDADGVDGKTIYVYGEGWDFGEVAQNARGTNATQLNLPGTGIGTFNDRIRDAIRGGSPFGGRQEQGFVNGLYYDNNGFTPGTEDEQKARLLHFADMIRVGLAGNLANYEFEGADGSVIKGSEVDYNGSPAGYTLDPQEQIAYAEAHDNETLFDKIQYAAPESATVADRVRMQNMGISIITLSQGVPFLHAGQDMLRSKSMDRNSYNSGDWFNKLDFTYMTNNWAVGLPNTNNQDMWPVIQPLLANPDIQPQQADIVQSVVHFQEMLKIRKSSRLFRLTTADDVIARLTFQNTGPEQLPGLIVMSVSDMGDLEDLDPDHELVVVLFNATDDEVTFTQADLADVALQLHPVQAVSADPVVQTSAFDAATGTFTVPARTTAVFVLPE